MADEGWVTVAEMSQTIGATEYRVRQALLSLGIQGKSDLRDARRTIYPPTTTERVKTWLLEH